MNPSLHAIEPLECRIVPAVLFAVEVGTNKLVSFDSAAPGTLTLDVPITGLQAGEIVEGIDVDPTSGKLIALAITDAGATRSQRLYSLDRVTGAATLLDYGTVVGYADVSEYGFDIQPRGQETHTTSSGDDHQISGPLGGLNATPLVQAVDNEAITAIAFDQTFGSTKTTLYGYNFSTDQLVTIGDIDGTPDDPGTSVVKVVGRVKIGGVDVFAQNARAVGLDIGGLFGAPEQGWLSINRTGVNTRLYNIDLATAALTDLGAIGTGTRLFSGLAVDFFSQPTIAAGGKVATWTDLDGDLVTLRITKGQLTPERVVLLQAANGSGLRSLDLNDASFARTDVILTARPGPNGGDGAVNIGSIRALGVDLGTVTVPGAVRSIQAGDSTPTTLGLKALNIRALDDQLEFNDGFQVQSLISGGLGALKIAGDLAGRLDIGNRVGAVFIGGDLVGGTGTESGRLSVDPFGKTGRVVIKGSIRGGSGTESGYLTIPAGASVTIGGSVIGGTGDRSGTLNVSGTPKSMVTVNGSLLGGDGASSGRITGGGVSSLLVKGDVRGGDGTTSGSISIGTGTSDLVKSITVNGSILSGTEALNIDARRIGTVLIKGSVIGSETAPVTIAARGLTNPATTAESVALGQLTVGGEFRHGRILAGVTPALGGVTADASIGSIKIGGTLRASSISAGIVPVNGVFGDDDETFVGNNPGSPDLTARIASITVGSLVGTLGGAADRFGIHAEQIGGLTVGKTKLPLAAAGKDNFLLGFTGDIRVREL